MARPRGGRRPPASARRSRRRGRRNRSSDLVARVAVAIPAIIFAVVIVASGGLVFALGVGALGIVCLAELYGLLDRAHPIRLAGFITMIALVLAAQYGSQFQVFLVAVAAVPVLFGLVLLGPRRRGATASMAATLLGIYWIGFAIAHAVLLRNLLHGDAIIVDVLVGTFLVDTGAYFGGRLFGRRPLAPVEGRREDAERGRHQGRGAHHLTGLEGFQDCIFQQLPGVVLHTNRIGELSNLLRCRIGLSVLISHFFRGHSPQTQQRRHKFRLEQYFLIADLENFGDRHADDGCVVQIRPTSRYSDSYAHPVYLPARA